MLLFSFRLSQHASRDRKRAPFRKNECTPGNRALPDSPVTSLCNWNGDTQSDGRFFALVEGFRLLERVESSCCSQE